MIANEAKEIILLDLVRQTKTHIKFGANTAADTRLDLMDAILTGSIAIVNKS